MKRRVQISQAGQTFGKTGGKQKLMGHIFWMAFFSPPSVTVRSKLIWKRAKVTTRWWNLMTTQDRCGRFVCKNAYWEGLVLIAVEQVFIPGNDEKGNGFNFLTPKKASLCSFFFHIFIVFAHSNSANDRHVHAHTR